VKVLFVTKYYPPVEGGIERYGHMLCTELIRRGVYMEVIAACKDSRTSSIETIDGVKVY
jgi:hypothetical protein